MPPILLTRASHTPASCCCVQVGHEQFRAPEVLFQPSLIGLEYDGIHKMLANSVYKADIDLRKTLFGHIVLAGGSTMFQGARAPCL